MAPAVHEAAPLATPRAPRIVAIDRRDVERGRVADAADRLGRLTVSLADVRAWRAAVDVHVDGMPAGDPAWRTPAARDFTRALDHLFPYWAYFLIDGSPLLRTFAATMVDSTDPAASAPGAVGSLLDSGTRWRAAVVEVLEERWLPAMSFLGELVGWSEDDDLRMTVRAYRMLLGDGHSAGGPLVPPQRTA